MDPKAMKQSMDELVKMFQSRMAEFQGSLDKADSSSPTVASVAAEFSSFKSFMIQSLECLQQQVECLAKQVDQQEMRSRRKMLLVHGVEESDSENTSSLVIDVLKKHFKRAVTVSDLSRSHRMGRPQSSKTRSILVKFRDVSLRDDIWFAKTALKGTGITLSEFLTKSRHDTFMAARDQFGVRNCWTRDGNVIVLGVDGKRNRVASLAELKKIPSAAPAPAAGTASAVGAGASKEAAKETKRTRNPGKRH